MTGIRPAVARDRSGQLASETCGALAVAWRPPALPPATSASVATRYGAVSVFRRALPLSRQPPDDGSDFMDVQGGERRGHTSPRGGVYCEDQTYSDHRVLLGAPGRLRPQEARGHRRLLPRQRRHPGARRRPPPGGCRPARGIRHSTRALVAPQFAVDALDSSAGRFWQPGAFPSFMGEAATALASL